MGTGIQFPRTFLWKCQSHSHVNFYSTGNPIPVGISTVEAQRIFAEGSIAALHVRQAHQLLVR